MKKDDLKEILVFPLYLALGALFFSLCAFSFFGAGIMIMAMWFALGMCFSLLFLCYIFKEEIEKYEQQKG